MAADLKIGEHQSTGATPPVLNCFEDGLLLENEDVTEYIVRRYTPYIKSSKKVVIHTYRDIRRYAHMNSSNILTIICQRI